MIDRQARDEMATLIRRYLDREIGSFALADGLDSVAESTDPLVHEVEHTLWPFYDDVLDTEANVDEASWKAFQRLLLLLESDAEIELETTRIWGWSQRAAAAILALVVALSWGGGWAVTWALGCILGLLPSVVISKLARRRSRSYDRWARTLWPFPSVAALARVRRQTRTFQRMPFPDPGAEKLSWLHRELPVGIGWPATWLSWFFFTPWILAMQAIPERRSNLRLRIDERDLGSAPAPSIPLGTW